MEGGGGGGVVWGPTKIRSYGFKKVTEGRGIPAEISGRQVGFRVGFRVCVGLGVLRKWGCTCWGSL